MPCLLFVRVGADNGDGVEGFPVGLVGPDGGFDQAVAEGLDRGVGGFRGGSGILRHGILSFEELNCCSREEWRCLNGTRDTTEGLQQASAVPAPVIRCEVSPDGFLSRCQRLNRP